MPQKEVASPAEKSMGRESQGQEAYFESSKGTLDSIRCFRAFYQHDVFLKL